MLDVFNDDAFSMVSLTTAINKLPYKPGRLGKMGLFRSRGIPTLTAVVEEQHGTLVLIPTAARGTMPNVLGGKGREARAFQVPHCPLNANVMADDVQGVRAFGTENGTQAVASLVNDKLTTMKQSHEVTHEYYRIGAIQGKVLDADGSTELFDFFDEFTISETEVEFDFETADTVKAAAMAIVRHIEDSLGAMPYNHIHAVCGNNFWDALIASADAKTAHERYQSGQFFREQQDRGGFPFVDVLWENYRGKVGSIDFIDADTCRFFPVGVPDLFQEIAAPANFIETVNTVGKPYYAKQRRLPFDVGIEMHTQSNVLCMCTRPAVLVKGVLPTPSVSSAGSGSGSV